MPKRKALSVMSRKSLLSTGRAVPLKERFESSEKKEWFEGAVPGEAVGFGMSLQKMDTEHLRGITQTF